MGEGMDERERRKERAHGGKESTSYIVMKLLFI